MTHRSIANEQDISAQVEYVKWKDWWSREGAAAPIYKSTECGDLVPFD
ncbi:MAG: hypothetical protein H0X25_21480 [Acidobacteriales bacterium]|nr:hypothetical protein [Terriglobales bacterium]